MQAVKMQVKMGDPPRGEYENVPRLKTPYKPSLVQTQLTTSPLSKWNNATYQLVKQISMSICCNTYIDDKA